MPVHDSLEGGRGGVTSRQHLAVTLAKTNAMSTFSFSRSIQFFKWIPKPLHPNISSTRIYFNLDTAPASSTTSSPDHFHLCDFDSQYPSCSIFLFPIPCKLSFVYYFLT